MKNASPLVSIIIPTYNRAYYFKIALESAIAQSYKNIEIIVMDDSTNFDTYHEIQPYLHQYPFIRYFRNEKTIGGALNFIKGFQYCTGEYINFLMDDDVFHPTKIQTMLNVFLSDTANEITLVTSYRSFIDENGNTLPDSIYNKKRFLEISKVDGIQVGDSIISEFNWVGEPTTPLFRKRDLIAPFGVFSNRLYRSGVDIAAWLNLLKKGNLVYIPDPLSQLRLHSNNISKDTNMRLNAIQDLIHLLFHCRNHGFLKTNEKYQIALNNIHDLFLIYTQHVSFKKIQPIKFYYYSLIFKKLFSDLH